MTIVEGEWDQLACVSAGVQNALSVPDGACVEGAAVSDAKMLFLPNCEGLLAPFSKFILATDNDGPGKWMARAIAERIGLERCYTVEWPEDCKDANEVLMKHGASALQAVIANPLPWPIKGILYMRDYLEDFLTFRDRPQPRGVSTGWTTVDPLYRVGPGELTVITGIPGHGKSEWLDAVMVNIAKSDGWKFGVMSQENTPVEHAIKISMKLTGKPYWRDVLRPGAEQTPQDLSDAAQFMEDHFIKIYPEKTLFTIDEFLRIAKQLVFRDGINGLVCDPWNRLEHSRPKDQTETEYVAAFLTKMQFFAQSHHVHVWVVAHPAKAFTSGSRHEDAPPKATPYDIAGSAHWFNMTDNAITVWRWHDEEPVSIIVNKIRKSPRMGKKGEVCLSYNTENGRYANERFT